MKHIYRIFPIALMGLVAVMMSCEDNRLNDIVDDQIYFLEPGLNQQLVFNMENATTEVALIKSGIGNQSGSVRVSVNEGLVDAYNVENSTEYLPLPGDMYSIVESQHQLDKDDYRLVIAINVNGLSVRSLQQETGLTYVIPLQAQVVSGGLGNSEPQNLETLVVPQVIDPYLALSNSGLVSGRTIINFDSPDKIDLFSSVEVNFPNKWNIDFDIEIEPDLVKEYNEQNGTTYKVLHEGAYSIDRSSLSLKEFEDRHGFGFELLKEGFFQGDNQYEFGDFLIPIRLVSKSDFQIDPAKQTQLLQVSFRPNELNRSSWEIADWNSCICEEPQYEALNRVPENLIDGDPESYWGSKWDEPKPFPYYIVFDMKSPKEIFQVELVKPTNETWRGNLKSGYFEISDDGENWARLGEWTMEDNAIRSHLYSVTPQSGQFVKLVIEEAFDYFDAEIGIGSGANVDLAEFIVWGR